MRQAVFVENGKVVNLIVLEDGPVGDEAVATLGCIEVSDLNPIPQIGWDFDGESFFYTSTPEDVARQQEIDAFIQARESAVAKLAALGLSEAEAKALFGGV